MSKHQSIKDIINNNPDEISFFENEWQVLFQKIKNHKNINEIYSLF